MQRIADALELLTAQHDEIEALLHEVATTTDLDRRARAITDLADRVTVHLAVEQELFYPTVTTSLSPEVHAELLAEHGEIKRVLADLLWIGESDARLERELSALAVLIDCHATWQEHDLFETVAETHTREELAALGSEITGWIDGLIVHEPVAA